ncbi:tRNA (adenosine(37)-N6)-threonylcarbamoyltransferase complex dimerization subunit type 1 TsaB [Candidatus Phytoplasma solani]|uniref:tRNA threonylcarbamoyladenosine biosynthesis protein TsaB n=2 Tax=Candidatus Phytoplasma solani TaxID=69896 RepID=A0A421NUX3_9MOLU|nr:tRNA (adenosine(37)-N6)-threonylcarbamoyltransferase complex dimerization subunit type 1 TsaB [Candidatus Phytoplasma solani]RMI87802.1 tRNA threonylcarbamoyladenosine biosynthesis protein TsaB [Candidatus Phytoplasma solani]
MTKKNILILDTSTKSQIVVLSQDNQIKTLQQKLIDRDHVATIIPSIDAVLQANKITLQEIDLLVVGVGPGSYTGTRVAVLTAKMLAFVLQIPLYQISSLLLLTSGYLYQKLTPLIDARNDSFFALSLKNNQIVLKEGRYKADFLKTYDKHLLIAPETVKIALNNIYQFMTLVTNPHQLVPNYLVQTQAERDLKKDN